MKEFCYNVLGKKKKVLLFHILSIENQIELISYNSYTHVSLTTNFFRVRMLCNVGTSPTFIFSRNNHNKSC